MSGQNVKAAVVSINGAELQSVRTEGMIAVGGAEHEINENDVARPHLAPQFPVLHLQFPQFYANYHSSALALSLHLHAIPIVNQSSRLAP